MVVLYRSASLTIGAEAVLLLVGGVIVTIV